MKHLFLLAMALCAAFTCVANPTNPDSTRAATTNFVQSAMAAQQPFPLEPLKVKTAQKASVELPGMLLLEAHINILRNDDVLETNAWQSKGLNLYYLFEMPIGKSRFSFNPGFGVALEKYTFQNSRTLGYTTDAEGAEVLSLDTLSNTLGNNAVVRRSRIGANYLEVPLELRWHPGRNSFRRSWKVAIGASVGVLFDSFTKIKYREDGERKKIKVKERFNLNPIRYGAYGRVGVGGFSLFGYVGLSELFEGGNGPGGTQANPWRFGLSFDMF